MASINSFETTTYLVINGKKMTTEEYKKYKKEQNKLIQSKLSKKKQAEIKKAKKEKRKKRETEITILPATIKAIVRNAGPIKSLSAYYDNAYSQWGTIAKTILGLPEIERPFVLFRSDAHDIVSTIKEISEVAKGNEKAVFAYIQKLSWKLDNTKTKMKMLYSGVVNSGVLDQFADKECINGEGKRLGLRILMARTFTGIENIEEAVKALSRIAKGGLDEFEYNTDSPKVTRAYRKV